MRVLVRPRRCPQCAGHRVFASASLRVLHHPGLAIPSVAGRRRAPCLRGRTAVGWAHIRWRGTEIVSERLVAVATPTPGTIRKANDESVRVIRKEAGMKHYSGITKQFYQPIPGL